MNIRLIVFFCLAIFLPMSLLCIKKGSTTAVSIQDWFEFPSADTDNEMVGFGWFKNGFGLEDYMTSCTFNSVYPVSGLVDLKGGTLYLQEDLILQNFLQLQGLGNIIGNSHRIQLPCSVSELPDNLTRLENVGLFLNSDVDLDCPVIISGHVKIVGNGNKFELEDDAQLIIDNNSTLELQNMLLENVGNDNIRCIDDSGVLILDNVTWCQMHDMTFAHGAILFQSKVDFLGEHTFIYDSVMTSTVDDESVWCVDGGMTVSLGRKTLGGAEPIYFYDEESIIVCGECTFHINENGWQITRGRVEYNKNTIIETVSTDTTRGAILGDGVHEEQDATIVLGPGCQTIFSHGALAYNNVAPDKFYSLSPNANFTRKIGSVFHIATTTITPQCNLIFEFDGIHFPPTTLAPGAQLYYDNTNIVIPGFGTGVFKARREESATFFLDQNDSIFLSNGQFQGNIQIMENNNLIGGTGCLAGNIGFQDYNSSVMCSLDGQIHGAISFNGGSMVLTNDLTLTKPDCFASGGNLNIGNHTVDFNFAAHSFIGVPQFTSAMQWIGDNGFINLMNQNADLKSTWTIEGIITVNGNGNTLALADQGKIVITSGSTLTIRDCFLDIIDNGDIVCLDDSSTIIFKNVSWMQHSDVVFSSGTLKFQDNVRMLGDGYTFTYASDQPITILSDSVLLLDRHFTFNYAPTSGAQDLFQLEDYTSELILNFATLHVPITGMHLKGGQLTIRQNSTILCDVVHDLDGALINEGLTVGDGYNPDNDILINFSGDKVLTIASGALNYKNVKSDAISMCNQSSIDVMSNSWLRVYENMFLGNGGINFYKNSVLAVMPDKQIFGSAHSAGEFSSIIIS